MDETALWNFAPLRRTYVPSNMTGYIRTPDVEHRDSLVIGLVGDGRILPQFMIESKPARKRKGQVIEKAVKGMTAEIMTQWLLEIFLPNRKDIKYLILDRASSHIANKVKLFAVKNDIELIFMPAKTAPDLSPLDNGFFAQFKSLLHGHPLGTFKEKKETVELILKQISKETVQKYFIHCRLCYGELSR